MLYKDNKKFIFVHIPKNAGNTIRESIFELPNNDIKIVSRIEDAIEYTNLMNEHLTYDEHLEKYKRYNSEDLFSFCFLRNPYERFISTYNYLAKEYFLTNGCLIRSKTSRLFIDKKNTFKHTQQTLSISKRLLYYSSTSITQRSFIEIPKTHLR